MPRSHPLHIDFALEAELDFIDILIFTEETFGFPQKEIYADWINTAIARISMNPEFGKKTSKPDYFRYHISWVGNRGSHYLYYCVMGSGREDSFLCLGLLCIPRCSHLSEHESVTRFSPARSGVFPPTEACLRFSRTSLFIWSLTRQNKGIPTAPVEAAGIWPGSAGSSPK